MNAHDTPCRVTADLRQHEAEQDKAFKAGDRFEDRVSEIERAMTNDEIAVEIMEGNAIDEGCVEILTMVLDEVYKMHPNATCLVNIDCSKIRAIASKARYRAAEAMAEQEGY